jgi:hypothetical protein
MEQIFPPGKKSGRSSIFFSAIIFSLNATYIPFCVNHEYILSYMRTPDKGSEHIMCQKLGESITAPITAAASGVVSSSQTGVVVAGWACNKTACPSYGKWYCPFSW